MKNFFFALIAIVAITFTSCSKDRITGSGSISTENRQVDQFTSVGLNGSTDVNIIKGNSLKVEVEGYQNLLPYFETKVVNGRLMLGYKEHANIRHSNIEVTITMPALKGVYLNGSGDITSGGNFSGDDIELNISGSGNIKLQEGYAKTFTSRISGSGDIQAYGFSADKATVHVSGSGTTRITANTSLNVNISGSGNVYYKGSPNVTSSISGSGRVIKQ